MQATHMKEKLIKSKTKGLALKNHLWSSMFALILARLEESLAKEGFNLEIVDGRLCHTTKLTLKELYDLFPHDSKSSVTSTLRSLRNHGYIVMEKYPPQGASRSLSTPEFVIELSPELYAELGRVQGRTNNGR